MAHQLASESVEVTAATRGATATSPLPLNDGYERIAWRVNREMVVLLGWGPAILMQVAHPLVAAAIADHSVFLQEPARRLERSFRTLRTMLAIVFGDEEQVAHAGRRITGIHDGVHGHLAVAVGPFPAGTPYSAHDPELLRWVHATLVYALPHTYEALVGPLTPEEHDRYCLEALRTGPLLGIPDALLPRDQAALRAYLRGMLASDVIAPSPTARAIARELIAPSAPWWVRPLRPVAYLLTVGLLPPAFRRAYDLRWTRRHAQAFHFVATLARGIIPRLPWPLRHWPAYRAALRQWPGPPCNSGS